MGSQVRVRGAALSISLGLAALVGGPTSARGAETAVTLGHETIVRATGPSGLATIRIVASKLPPGSPISSLFLPPGFYRPTTALSLFEVKIGGKPVVIPLSALADLFDVHRARAFVQSKAYVIELSGGDGSESYTAQLTIRDGRMMTRTMSPGEHDRWTEKTQYREIELP